MISCPGNVERWAKYCCRTLRRVGDQNRVPLHACTHRSLGMSEVQRKVYKGVLMRDIDTVNGASVGRTAILNIVMQLRKCCNHPYLFPNTEDRNLDPMGEHLVENCGKVRTRHDGRLRRADLPEFVGSPYDTTGVRAAGCGVVYKAYADVFATSQSWRREVQSVHGC